MLPKKRRPQPTTGDLPLLVLTEEVLIIFITWVVPDALSSLKVEVEYIPFPSLAGLPRGRQRGLQAFQEKKLRFASKSNDDHTLFCDPEKVFIYSDVHADPLGVLEDLLLCRFIIFVNLMETTLDKRHVAVGGGTSSSSTIGGLPCCMGASPCDDLIGGADTG